LRLCALGRPHKEWPTTTKTTATKRDIQSKHKLYEEPIAEGKRRGDRDARPNQRRNMDGARRGKHGPKPNENKKNKKSTSTGKQKGAVAVVLIQVVLHRPPPR